MGESQLTRVSVVKSFVGLRVRLSKGEFPVRLSPPLFIVRQIVPSLSAARTILLLMAQRSLVSHQIGAGPPIDCQVVPLSVERKIPAATVCANTGFGVRRIAPLK